ncbi:MAG: hypothetical protein KTR14_02075 [Vampirovibrio sp.]|nr:hypothetical protein [Vampirovibrio sp.]
MASVSPGVSTNTTLPSSQAKVFSSVASKAQPHELESHHEHIADFGSPEDMQRAVTGMSALDRALLAVDIALGKYAENPALESKLQKTLFGDPEALKKHAAKNKLAKPNAAGDIFVPSVLRQDSTVAQKAAAQG